MAILILEAKELVKQVCNANSSNGSVGLRHDHSSSKVY